MKITLGLKLIQNLKGIFQPIVGVHFCGRYSERRHALVCRWLYALLVTVSMPGWAGSWIVHPDTDVSALSGKQINNILSLRKKNWPDDQRITIVVPSKDVDEYRDFMITQLRLFPYQLQRHWDRANFSGKASSPIFRDPPDELIKAVMSTPGAIGFIPDDAITEGLRLVQITP